MVLRTGSDSEMMSVLFGETTEIIAQAPGIARGDRAAASPPRRFPRPSSSSSSTCRRNRPARRPTCRCAAFSRRRFATRPDLKITAGRTFEWGKNEILVGEGARKQFRGLDVGIAV